MKDQAAIAEKIDGVSVRKVTGLLMFGIGCCFVANFVARFVEPNKVLIVIVILIVIDTGSLWPDNSGLPGRLRPTLSQALSRLEPCHALNIEVDSILPQSTTRFHDPAVLWVLLRS